MRVSLLFVVVALGMVGVAGQSHAEKVKTNQSARVYARPGEQGKVIVTVKSGQTMTVLAKEGRWLKVRVSGRTGFVPRSKVDIAEDEEFRRNSRRSPFVSGRGGTDRRFGGGEGPDDRVGADAIGDDASDSGDGDEEGDKVKPKIKAKPKAAPDEEAEEPVKAKHKPKAAPDEEAEEPVKAKHKPKAAPDEEAEDPLGSKRGDDAESTADGDEEQPADRLKGSVRSKTTIYNDPSKDSGESFAAKPGDVLFVGEKKGKYTFVETEEGDAGYVLTSKLDVDESSGGGGDKRTRLIDLRARVGVTFVQQSVRSAGGTKVWPDNYNIGSSSFNLAVGAASLHPFKQNLYIGGEMAYDFAKALPGVAFDPDGTAGPIASSTTGFSLHNFNLRAVIGYDLHKQSGMIVFGRLGYHYTSFQVNDVADLVKNTARLPSETLGAPTLGAAISLPRLTSKVGLRFSLDAVLFGASVKQTVNLEDGSQPTAKGATAGAGLTYRWRSDLDIQATYDLNYTSLSFGAPPASSMRGHMATSVSRSDVNHTIAFGVAKAF